MVDTTLGMFSKNHWYHILGELGSCNWACYIYKGHYFLDSISLSSNHQRCSSLGLRTASLMCRTHHLHRE